MAMVDLALHPPPTLLIFIVVLIHQHFSLVVFRQLSVLWPRKWMDDIPCHY